MRLIFLYILITLTNVILSQNSYIELLEKGEGNVNIGYHNFSNEEEDKNQEGFEREILNIFFDYVENKKGVEINEKYISVSSFNLLYNNVKSNKLDFGYCFFSITPKRKKQVYFSPPYMPNIEVLVSNKKFPIVSDTNEFREKFNGATILYVPQTIYEKSAKKLKLKYPKIKLKPVESSTKLMREINRNKKYFGFAELQQYFLYQEECKNIVRQNIFLKKREGYGFILPLGSDWKPIIDLFFLEKKEEIKTIIQNRFDSDMVKFIDNIQKTNTEDLNLMILMKEKKLEEIKSLANKLLYDNQKLENLKIAGERKELRRNLMAIIALLIIAISVAFIAYRLKVKHNKEIIYKNNQLAIQKNIVEKKHKEIKDSINYAKRIQNALLQEEKHLTSLLPPCFIFFEPKDVVSGDFYWSKTFDKHYYISVTDCTGHGVPGGFMSVLGIAMLNEITRLKKRILPSDMLNILRDKIIQELAQTSSLYSNKDGMNTVVLKINRETLEMNYAGAYQSILIIRDGKLIELKTDKEPIGFTYIMTPFIDYEFQLMKNDLIYLYTDGYVDQFGGEKGKKFKTRAFKELLLSIHNKTLEEQKNIISDVFKKWKGNEEQIDDVTVLGMKI